MLLRVYRARVKPGKERLFEDVMFRSQLPVLRRTPGCLDIKMGRTLGAEYEFVVVTLWASLEALVRFAGPRWQESVVAPEERGLVEAAEVENYEVVSALDAKDDDKPPVAR